MAQIVFEAGQEIIRAFKPELASREVRLSRVETTILKQARDICEKASELQAQINEVEGVRESDNDFSWAEIYLRSILR